MFPSDLERLSELDRLLDQALDLSPVEQQAWLLQISSADPALAERLAELIASEPALDASGFLQPPTAAVPVTSLAGRRIGAYTLERPLGRGGMGTVWLARRSDGRFEGRAAIKLLNLPLLDTAGAERFRREATALARLAHPNIARLTDAGVAEDGQPYLVLEHVDGVPLDRYADERRLSPSDRLALLLQVLDAVSHAHANLIVHRDIKPSNLLVTGDGTVKLLDFGIAKLLAADGADGERSVRTDGAAALTPEYAAPEQVTGAAITVATDVYSLGVLMYLLLSGRHPTGQGAATSTEHVQRLLDVTPTRLSSAASRPADGDPTATARVAVHRAASPERLRRMYRGDLDNIAARALKKAPSERYGTVAAFADDLRRFLRHQPVHARPDTLGYRTRKFVRRNRVAVTAGMVVASLLLVTTGYALYQLDQATRQRDEARVQRDRAVFERQRSAASDNYMQAVLSTIGASEQIGAGELLRRGRALLEQASGTDPRFVAPLMIQLASQYHFVAGTEGLAAERELLERGAVLARQGGDPQLEASAECRLALYAGRTEFDTVAANAHWQLGSRLLRHSPRQDPDVAATCLVAGAYTNAFAGRSAAAMELLQRFDSVLGSNADSLSMSRAEHRLDASDVWIRLGRLRPALAEARRCDALLLRLGHSNSMLHVSTLTTEYFALNRLGEFRTADSANQEWLDLARRRGADMTGFAEVHAAAHALWLGQSDSAVRIWRRRVERARRDGTISVGTLMPLIGALTAAKLFPEARAAVAEAQRRPDAPVARLLIMRGRLAETEGRAAAARSAYDSALAALRAPGARERLEDNWYVLWWDARVALVDGDVETADGLARQAFAAARQYDQDELQSGHVGQIRLVQARIALVRHDTASARTLVRLALPPLEHGFGSDRPETLEARALAAQLGGQ